MSPPSEQSRVAVPPQTSEFSLQERQLLLRMAHEAILADLENRPLDLTPPTAHLAEQRGAFTTLHFDGKLCGCIGYVLATKPLYRTVAETARAAAFDDPRFLPVSLDEARRLTVEISVLSPLKPIRPEDVVVGLHGLVVSKNDHRGLLLPQVPLEWGWDRETFLSQTAMKAGLSPNAWREGAELQAFTAEVFGDTTP